MHLLFPKYWFSEGKSVERIFNGADQNLDLELWSFNAICTNILIICSHHVINYNFTNSQLCIKMWSWNQILNLIPLSSDNSLCPSIFKQNGLFFKWIAEKIYFAINWKVWDIKPNILFSFIPIEVPIFPGKHIVPEWRRWWSSSSWRRWSSSSVQGFDNMQFLRSDVIVTCFK